MRHREGNRRRRGRTRAAARFVAALAATGTLAAPAVAPAASFTWDGGGNSNDWSTNNNWSPNGAPLAANTNDAITFAGTVRLTPNLDASRTIASLAFANTAGAFTLGSSTASALTIGAGGITQNDNDAQTINHALALGAAQTWNASAGNLVVDGSINLGGHTLTNTGTFATSLQAVVSGTGGITKTGGGTLRLSAANSFSGGVTVSAVSPAHGGTVVVADNSALGTGTLTLNRGDLQAEGVIDLSNPIDISNFANHIDGDAALNQFTISGPIGGTGTLTMFTGNVRFAGTLPNTMSDGVSAFNSTLTLAKPAGVNAVAGNLLIGRMLASSITSQVVQEADEQVIDSASVNIPSGGLWNLAQGNRSETIDSLQLSGYQGNTGSGVSTGSGTLTVTGGILSSNEVSSFAGTTTISGNVSLGGGGTVPLMLSGKYDGSGQVTNTLNLNAVVSGGVLAYEGTNGRLNLTAANTNNGFVFKNFMGQVDIGHNSALGIGTVTVDPGALIGHFRVVNGPKTVSNNFVLNYDAGFETVGDLTLTGTLSGSGRLLKSGLGTLTLTNAGNSYAGQTHIANGTVSISSDGALGAVPAAFVANHINLAGGVLHASANVTLAANRGINVSFNTTNGLRGNPGVTFTPSTLSGSGDVTFATNGSPATPAIFPLTAANTTFTGRTTIDGAIVTIAQDANLSAAPATLVPDKLTLTNGATLRVTSSMTLAANRGVTVLNSGAGGAGGAFEINSSQTLTTSGPISGAGALTKRGAGTLNLGTAHGYTGTTTLDAGTVIAQQDASFGAAPPALVADHLTINAATLRWTANGPGIAATRGVRLAASSSTINVDAGVTLPVNSPLSGTGGLTKTGSGTLNLLGSNSYSGATSIGGGRLVLNQSFATNTSFAVSLGAVLELAQAPVVTLKTSSIITSGKVDLKDNKLVITSQPLGTWNGAAYTGVTGMIASAYTFSGWSGNGITTTMPAAIEGLTSVGVLTAELASLQMFGGMTVAPSNVLVMYTWAGDANLDGLVDAADYGMIDHFIQFPGSTGYGNGDFNYDGVIDAADYGIIDNTIQLQGPPFPVNSAPAGLAAGVTAVPEPSACGLALLAAGLLRRGRRPGAF